MSNVAIRVENIGKRYRRGEDVPYRRLSEMLQGIPAAALRAARGSLRPRTQSAADSTGRHGDFWALKDVSFDVQEGEVLGVIGRNGAGKSTLLKVLSRITEPTTGRFGVRGRLASLLEVGTGFHPELTGRENIYLSGTILGMSRAEIKRHFDEIVAFAEIDEFLDTPVKRYSSGMYVRLGFAIAAHLQPEILIVDEVLAVGDAAFQKKCLGKMGDIARSGRTVLFVSHNQSAIVNLCSSAVLVEKGRIAEIGVTESVVRAYQAIGQRSVGASNRSTLQTFEDFVLRGAIARPAASDVTDRICANTSITLDFDFEVTNPNAVFSPSLVLKTADGYPVFNSLPGDTVCGRLVPFTNGLNKVRCLIPADLLNAGRYSVDFYVVRDGHRVEHCFEDLLYFDVEEPPAKELRWFGKRIGAVRPLLFWDYQRDG